LKKKGSINNDKSKIISNLIEKTDSVKEVVAELLTDM